MMRFLVSFLVALVAGAAALAAPPPTPTSPTLSAQAIDCGVASCTSITPTLDLDGSVVSAGRGLVTAAIWNATPWWNNGTRQDSSATNTGSQSQLPHSAIVYMRPSWSMVEPTKDGYIWEDPDNDFQDFIDTHKAAGRQVAFRIITHNPNIKPPQAYINAQNPAITAGWPRSEPQWFIDAATTRGQCTSVGTAPNYLGQSGGGSQGGCGYYKNFFAKGSCVWRASRNAWMNGDDAICADLFVPNYNEPPVTGQLSYQERMLLMIESFSEHVLTPENLPWIAFVDVGMAGSWGEMHHHNEFLQASGGGNSGIRLPTPKYDYMVAMLEKWLTETPKSLPKIINFQASTKDSFESWSNTNRRDPANFDGWRWWCARARTEGRAGHIMGWRTDGVPDTGWKQDDAIAYYPELANCWRYGPIDGEPTGQFADSAAAATGLTWLAGHRGGLVNFKYTNIGSGTWLSNAITPWRSTSGYHLHPSRVVIPASATSAQTWNAEVEIRNAGFQRAFSRYHAPYIRFVPSSGTTVVKRLPVDLTMLEPGATATTRVRGVSLPAGTYSVQVGLAAAEGIATVPRMRWSLDQAGCTDTAGGGNWCAVGSLTISAP